MTLTIVEKTVNDGRGFDDSQFMLVIIPKIPSKLL